VQRTADEAQQRAEHTAGARRAVRGEFDEARSHFTAVLDTFKLEAKY
jgi:hypothetical protein